MLRTGQLVNWLVAARSRMFEYVVDLEPALLSHQLHGPSPQQVLVDLAASAERFILVSGAGLEPLGKPLGDESTWPEVLARAAEVQARLLHALMEPAELPRELADTVLHHIAREDLAAEGVVQWRHRHSLSAPEIFFEDDEDLVLAGDPVDGDVRIPAAIHRIGAPEGTAAALDNERWAHDVDVLEFSIARTPTTEEAFSEFVRSGGYVDRRLWSEAGWQWLKTNELDGPLGWRGADEIRYFNAWRAVDAARPVAGVSAHEADAFCRWAGRRLPSEAEWERAAAAIKGDVGGDAHPWGAHPAQGRLAALDSRSLEPIPVQACGAGDSGWGMRQMLGNVWEWTADTFAPYPGYVAEATGRYSMPHFGNARSLRGGCVLTPARWARNSLRRAAAPGDCGFAFGFRTCASRTPA